MSVAVAEPGFVLGELVVVDDESNWYFGRPARITRVCVDYDEPIYTVEVDSPTGNAVFSFALKECHVRVGPTERQLCNDLEAYCEQHKLPFVSADELLHHDLTDPQRRWISNFVLLWEAVMERQQEGCDND